MSYYKDSDKDKITTLAAIYDCQAMIHELAQRIIDLEKKLDMGPQNWDTRHWAPPAQDVDGDWVLPKPHGLECSTTGQVGDCSIVEEVNLPEDILPE
jgi:hypothetical protein